MKSITINGKDCTTKQALFNTFKDAFHFPDYFSYNWDGFEELLCDLSWIPDQEILLVIVDYQLIMNEEEEQDTFFEILSEVDLISEKDFYVELG